MRWVRRIESVFALAIRTKGYKYFRQGAVQITGSNPDGVQATVKGSRDYRVNVRMSGEQVIVRCDCAYFEGEDLCKHIYATLLAAESKGYLPRIASAWKPIVVEDLDETDDLQDPAYDFTPPELSEPVSTRSRATKLPKAKSNIWKQELSALRQLIGIRTPQSLEPARRIFYVVDIADCVSGGTLVMRSVVSKLKKNGEWGRPNFQENYIRNVSQLEPADQQILTLLGGSAVSAYAYQYSDAASVPARHTLHSAALGPVIPMLAATGRFFLRPNGLSDELKPLTFDDGDPWHFQIRMRNTEDGQGYSVSGYLKRGEEELPLAAPMLLVPGMAFFDNHVSRFIDGRAFEWVAFLRRRGEFHIPLKEGGEFVAEIAKFPALPPIDFPEELRIEPRSFVRHPHLKLRPAKDPWQRQDRLQCEIAFDYGISVLESNPAWAVHDPASNRHFQRDHEAETKAIQRLVDLGLRKTSSWNQTVWDLSPSRLPALVRTLVSEGWRIEAEGRLYRRSTTLNVTLSSGIDWLELEGGAEFEDQHIALPELLKAVSRGETMIRLSDGSYGLIAEEWLERYAMVARLGHTENGHIRFARGQAGLLDALLSSQPEVTFDEGFIHLREEMESFSAVEALDPPATFKGQLREYQREGLGWLKFLRRFRLGGCLADDMGLGKTVQVLALLTCDERRGPVLVVAPRSLIFNWREEAARFAPGLQVLDFTGVGRKDRWEHIHQHDIVLTTYGTMRRDAPQLREIRFDTVVLDEAQSIKNSSSESAKAARLLNGEHRLALTGTPIENHLGDLWSIFEFLNPGLLGSAAVFRSHTTEVAEESVAMLSKALRPFILRRTKEQVATELPPKTQQTIYCELKREQRKLYDELRDHYRATLLGRVDELGVQKSRMHILEALLRLRQAACHPGLIDPSRVEGPSAKLEVLTARLREVIQEGHKALVFSQFTSLLAIVRSRLDAEQITYEYLDGSTRNRQARVKRFQEDSACPVFLISLKAGGLGLNLTAAEYVFLLDPWWNPAVEAQAVDRSHRIGQSQHVFAYRLIAKDTVEEKVLELQASKRALADALITAQNSVLKELDRQTLELLLS
jgi:superfamily II DNA or RNA helicase